MKQHATGCGQGFGVQVAPPPCGVPLFCAQDGAERDSHEPSWKQHAAAGGQIFGVQEEPIASGAPPFPMHSGPSISSQWPSG